VRRTDDEILNVERIFFRMIKDYSSGHLGNKQHYLRGRVEASDPVGGQLEANPPNPPRSVRARVYTAGLDATTPREALVVFYPLGTGCPNPGEHVVVVFEDPQMTSGYWLGTVQAFHDQNYANPDFRIQNNSDSSYAFEGDVRTESQTVPELEYGGTSSQTQGRQDMIDSFESQGEQNPWQGKRVLLMGDSQVAGPFGAKLGEILRGSHGVAYFAREGRVGWGVKSWLNGKLSPSSPSMPSIQDVINQHRPDIVVISLGGNDGSNGVARRVDYELKVRELYNIVNQSVNFIIWSGPPSAVGTSTSKQPGREIAARKIQQVVADKFVNVFSLTQTTEGRARDGIHFTNSSPSLAPWAEEVIQKGYRLVNQ
jgi:lysophospholipase L1-like esterase